MYEGEGKSGQDAVLSGENFFALVGWEAVGLGGRMVLKLQGIRSNGRNEDREVHLLEFYLNNQQALQLGNTLFEASGNTPPRRKRSWLDRLIAGKSG
jgi:hypothetical protein